MRATAPVRVASSADPWGKKEGHWGYRQDGGARCVKEWVRSGPLGVETRTRFLVLATPCRSEQGHYWGAPTAPHPV